MSWQDTNQQAIEKYLEDLLNDDLSFEDEQAELAPEPLAKAAAIQEEPLSFSLNKQEESVQEQQLKSALLGKSFAQPEVAPQQKVSFDEPKLDFKEAEPSPEVILPTINLTPAKPNLETLADVLEEIESKQSQPVEATKPVEPEPKVEIQPEVKTEVTPKAEIKTQPAVKQEAKPEITPAAKIEAQQPAKDKQLSATQPPALPPSWKNGRPAWAQERFECLLFKVKGLTLAVPLVELGGIIKIEDEPTPLFGQPGWFLGLIRNNQMNVAMIDTAQWVLPPAIIDKNPEPYELIIRIHESHWGLACNQVDKSITLEPDQVRWRSSLTKRPWLAGTVIEHMCALIDVAAFDRLLKEGHGDLEPANLAQLKEGLAED